jgi:uncharacterized membrane protein
LMTAGAPDFSHLGELLRFILQRIQEGGKEFLRTGDLILLSSSAGLLLYLRYRRYREVWEAKQVALILLVIAMLLHAVLARTGWFFRYEAYLIAWGLIANVAVLAELLGTPEQPAGITRSEAWGGRLLMAFGMVILLLPLIGRAFFSLCITPITTKNIYEQQCQMSRFVQTYYPGSAVVINDIGAITYNTDVHCLDINGLATMDVARAIIHGTFTSDTLAALARKDHARIAILYDNPIIPPTWHKVGAWTISHNVVCAAPTEGFYAVDPAEVGLLTDHLRQFSSKLPPSVAQSGEYTQK